MKKKSDLLVKFPWLNLKPNNNILTLLVNELKKVNKTFIVIKGASSSGKTRLMLEAAKQIINTEKRWVACISAQKGRFNESLYKALGETHRLEHANFYKRLEMLLKQRALHSDQIILFVDDAQCLEEEQLQALYQLAQYSFDNCCFQLVLLVDESQINQLNSDILDASFQLKILPLSRTETEQLAEHLFDHLSIERALTQQELNELFHMSYGYPGRVINEIISSQKKQKFIARRYFYIIGIIISIILLGIIYFISNNQKKLNGNAEEKNESIEELLPSSIAGITKGDLLTSYEKTLIIDESSNSLINEDVGLERDELEDSAPDPTLIDSGNKIEVKRLVINQSEEDGIPGIPKEKQVENQQRHYIELARAPSKNILQEILSGRTIPGSLNTIQQGNEWVAMLGPYQTELQAGEGLTKLPHSLQELSPKVITLEKKDNQ